jgi:hypothetical protein
VSNHRHPTPPDPENWTSLWNGLHDAYLVSLVDPGVGSNVELEVQPGFPDPQGEFLQPLRLAFEAVTHASIFVNLDAPNGPRHTPGMPNADWQAAIAQHHRKARTESMSLREFGEKIRPRDLDAMDADFAMKGDQYCAKCVCADIRREFPLAPRIGGNRTCGLGSLEKVRTDGSKP